MADPEHLARLRGGVESWNRWRAEAPNTAVDLSGADPAEATLRYANLVRADLSGATLTRAQLELSRITGVARGTVSARLQRLEDTGVITGYGRTSTSARRASACRRS